MSKLSHKTLMEGVEVPPFLEYHCDPWQHMPRGMIEITLRWRMRSVDSDDARGIIQNWIMPYPETAEDLAQAIRFLAGRMLDHEIEEWTRIDGKLIYPNPHGQSPEEVEERRRPFRPRG